MPFPLIPVIAAAATAASAGISAHSAKRQQKKANKFNLEMWNRQNAYNSPAMQMDRYRRASLNPNLIYGSGAGGASGNASSTPSFEPLQEHGYRPVDIPGALQSFTAFADYDLKRASEDRVRTQIELDKAKTLSEITNNTKGILSNKKLAIELPFAKDLMQTSLDAQKQSIRKLTADTQYTLNQDERAAIQNSRSVIESIERVIQMRTGNRLSEAQIQNLREDNTVKQLQAELAKSGITPETPWYAKAIERALESLTEGEGLFKNLGKKFNPFK